MDFRQCPACQASVLDDDAAECPFCGASMSGKPAATPAKPAASAKPAAKPKQQAKAPAKAAAPKRQSPPRKVGETVADEDDPFGVDTSSVAQAPKVSPKPAKGRMIRLVCPMCETPGFISSKMQGRDVKCCNPECMVPVFKAPPPEKQVEEDDSKGGGLTLQRLGIALAVIVPITGLILWGFVFSRQSRTDQDRGLTDNTSPRSETRDSQQPDIGINEYQPEVQKEVPLEQIKRDALEQIVTAAQTRDDNRKAYGRRLAAEAYAEAGDLTNAQEQLSQLRRLASQAPYSLTEPLLFIAWQQLQEGDSSAASESIQQAGKSFRDLPEVGRAVLTAAISLSAAQAAFDQIDDAKATLRKVEPEPERARLASLIRIVSNFDSFDLDEILEYTSLDMTVDPMAVAVTTEIASHDRWDKSIAWARAQSDPASQEDCLTALAAFAARVEAQSENSGPRTQLLEIADTLPASGQARLHAGLATGYLMLGKRTEAEAALAQALELFATIERPTAFPTPDTRTIHDPADTPGAGLPDASPLRSAAVAAAQLARLQMLTDQREAAWTTLLQAWDFTAGIGPNYGEISALNEELNNSRSRVERRLGRALGISNRDDRYRAVNQYRAQLRDFDAAARQRFDLEAALLRDSADWGFQQEVAEFRKNPAGNVPIAEGQPYPQAVKEDRLAKLFAQTAELFRQGKFRETAAELGDFQDRHHIEQRRDQRAMQLACRLLKQKQVDELFRFVQELKDPWLMEDCLEMTAALGVRTGQASTIWRRFIKPELDATERIALYRGLISGIVAAERQAAQSQATAVTPTESAR